MIADAPLLRVRQAHNEHACVFARLELPRVREIQIVCHEQAVLGLSSGPYVLVASTTELLVGHPVDVVAQGGQS